MSRRLTKKWANYRRRYHWLRRTEKLPMGPLYINVEATNACNLKCTVCSRDGSRKIGVMKMDLFRKIIDDAAQSDVYEVSLFLAGESLLAKNLPEMVRYVEEKGLESWLVTNGVLLTKEKSQALLDAGLRNIWISLDGDCKEDYEALRVGAVYEEVVQNVLDLLELKKERGTDLPDVRIHMIKTKENPQQELRQDFADMFDDLPLNGIFTRNPHDWRGEKEGIPMEPRAQNYFPCNALWSAMSIGWDGKVVGCSADLNGTQIFGDVNEQSILEIWNNEEMRRHRRLLKEGRYEELPLCAGCHGLWFKGNPKLHVLSLLPPFDSMKPFLKRFYNPNKSDGNGGGGDGRDAGDL